MEHYIGLIFQEDECTKHDPDIDTLEKWWASDNNTHLKHIPIEVFKHRALKEESEDCCDWIAFVKDKFFILGVSFDGYTVHEKNKEYFTKRLGERIDQIPDLSKVTFNNNLGYPDLEAQTNFKNYVSDYCYGWGRIVDYSRLSKNSWVFIHMTYPGIQKHQVCYEVVLYDGLNDEHIKNSTKEFLNYSSARTHLETLVPWSKKT